MVSVDAIGWGSYRSWEGPLYWGKRKYHLPANPTEGDKILQVITTTEGGTYDAYNGYDRCICTSGLIQWCDRAPFFLVTKLLGAVAQEDPELLRSVTEYIGPRGYTFKKRPILNGVWRFYGPTGLVDSTDRQRELYFGSSYRGKKGTFPEDKSVAKEWAAACSSVWEQEEAQRIQREHTIPRLYNFATKTARPILETAKTNGGDVGRAFCAAYLSFAANNPKRASDALSWVVMNHGVEWTQDWLNSALRALVFRPGIAIYPHRYDKIHLRFRKPLFKIHKQRRIKTSDVQKSPHVPRHVPKIQKPEKKGKKPMLENHRDVPLDGKGGLLNDGHCGTGGERDESNEKLQIIPVKSLTKSTPFSSALWPCLRVSYRCGAIRQARLTSRRRLWLQVKFLRTGYYECRVYCKRNGVSNRFWF